MNSKIHWLLKSDAAIRWQVMRDLMDAPKAQWETERKKIATTGWGEKLLSKQDADGNWGGGLYSPKWTSTTSGCPSRWNTLRALRVLRWWNQNSRS